jgi:hypothetical protein
MRKSLLKLIIVGALAGWAAPGLAQDSPQQQRVPASVTMADGSLTYWLGDPPSSTKRSDCSAGSAKDVVASKTWRDRCE